MADSDSKDSTNQYYKDLVNISIDADDTGSDISVYTVDPDQLLTMGVKGKHCDNAGLQEKCLAVHKIADSPPE